MIRISGSVGRGGQNRFIDVATVQTLLNDNLHLLIPMRPIDADGKIGPVTIGAIEEYQRRVVGQPRPDGRVDPGNQTFNTLVARRRETDSSSSRAITAIVSRNIRFPLQAQPAQSYKTGMRRFGARRSGGRLHAGCDLYAPVGTSVLAMDEGTVLRDVYAFYLGTYALDVQHPEFVARYGEIGGVADGVRKGAQLQRGQVIGTVGRLRGLNMSMLHLELYSGQSSGGLTVRENRPYRRRSDLMDPTSILDRAVML